MPRKSSEEHEIETIVRAVQALDSGREEEGECRAIEPVCRESAREARHEANRESELELARKALRIADDKSDRASFCVDMLRCKVQQVISQLSSKRKAKLEAALSEVERGPSLKFIHKLRAEADRLSNQAKALGCNQNQFGSAIKIVLELYIALNVLRDAEHDVLERTTLVQAKEEVETEAERQAGLEFELNSEAACAILREFWVFFCAPVLDQGAFAHWVCEVPERETVVRSLTAGLLQVMGEVRYYQLFSGHNCPSESDLLERLREIFTFDSKKISESCWPPLSEHLAVPEKYRAFGEQEEYIVCGRYFRKTSYGHFIDFINKIGESGADTHTVMMTYIIHKIHLKLSFVLDQYHSQSQKDEKTQGQLLVICQLRIWAREQIKTISLYSEGLPAFALAQKSEAEERVSQLLEMSTPP